MQACVYASVHSMHRTAACVPPRELESVRRKHGSREGARSPTPPWEEVKDDEDDDLYEPGHERSSVRNRDLDKVHGLPIVGGLSCSRAFPI
jgi:hypothetical protein